MSHSKDGVLHRDAGAARQEGEVQDGGAQSQVPAEGVAARQGKPDLVCYCLTPSEK